MTVEKPFHHRSSLKQKNKPFKGGSRSQSQSRGRVARKKPAAGATPAADLCKRDRRNRAAMVQHSKREELSTQRRIYAGRDGMPRIIAIIPVTGSVQMDRVLPFASAETIYSERNKQNLHFVPIRREGLEHSAWMMRILDVAQVADCILLAASSLDADLDGFGRDALALMRGIGASSTAAVVQHLSSHKHPQQVRAAWLNSLQAAFSSVGKVHCADSMFQEEASREAVELERTLCQQHLSGLSWRDIRPYMIADVVQEGGSDDSGSTVKVTGFIRGGKAFSADKLVYLPLLGAHYAVSHIEAVVGRTARRSDDMEVDGPQIQRRGEGAETLDAECAGNDDEAMFSASAMMQAAEEMAHGCGGGGKDETATKLVPKGTSAYQAAWLDETESPADGEEPLEAINPDAEEEEESSAYEGAGNDMAVEEYEAQLAEYKLQFSERHFPDEIELDPRISARTRLQKYRGVQSLRTSTWDANENLPAEYGRIFRFANYKQSRKAALEEEDSPFHVGQRVAIHIEGVPAEQALILRNAGRIVLFGMLKHEQRQTVLNFTLNRSKAYDEPILNKEELVAVIGMRRYTVNPVWSEASTGNLHKMIRAVGVEQKTVVGTIYAPVAYTPCPILMFRLDGDSGELRLVGSGSLVDADPHRIVLKRITLTGTPFRVHKRSAVVRFMFPNPADVLYFKPIELTTRSGARGHIRESLGTHGYMKCLFDRTIFHHDTVAMHLYKRVFPKWTTRGIGSV